MAAAEHASRNGRFGTRTPRPAPTAPVNGPQVNSISASQARAAHRRAARRDELAVAAWLRELAGPTR
jgi:hypothetical protein